MSKTSTEVKRRYNAKTYSNWNAPIRKEDFAMIEELRGDMSRAKFLLMLVDKYKAELPVSQEEPAPGEK